MTDAINPGHYKANASGVECITVVEHLDFCLGNAVKYLWRAGLKGDLVEDLQKARWYLNRALMREGIALEAELGRAATRLRPLKLNASMISIGLPRASGPVFLSIWTAITRVRTDLLIRALEGLDEAIRCAEIGRR